MESRRVKQRDRPLGYRNDVHELDTGAELDSSLREHRYVPAFMSKIQDGCRRVVRLVRQD